VFAIHYFLPKNIFLMRKLPFLSLVFILFQIGVVSAQKTIETTLQDALDQKLIEVNFNGNEKSTHYLKPLKGKITNISEKILVITIPAGSFFSSDPVDYQDIVVTQEQLLSLSPEKSQILELYGVCVESSNACPAQKTKYTLQASPNPQYLALAQYVNAQKYYGLSETQHAFWVLSDDDSLEEIWGYKKEVSNNLLIKMVEITGKAMPDTASLRKSYQISDNGELFEEFTYTPTRAMSGNFFFQLNKTKKVLIGMFTENGVLVRELYNNPTCATGNHKIEYAFDASVYADPIYHFKLITDEYIWIDMPVGKR